MRRCAAGKVAYKTVRAAELHAAAYARDLNARRELASDMYGYRCRTCHAWHITHHAVWDGEPMRLLFKAPATELQRWAFPPVPTDVVRDASFTATPDAS